MGHIQYDEIDVGSYTLLKLDEITGVDKQTVFGLGERKMKENDRI